MMFYCYMDEYCSHIEPFLALDDAIAAANSELAEYRRNAREQLEWIDEVKDIGVYRIEDNKLLEQFPADKIISEAIENIRSKMTLVVKPVLFGNNEDGYDYKLVEQGMIIYSANEAATNEAGFWNNEFGWVEEENEATVFSPREVISFPMCLGNDAVLLSVKPPEPEMNATLQP